jgi:hypothetical protein
MRSKLLRATVLLPPAVCAALLPAPAMAQIKAALVRDIDRPQAQPVSGRCSANVCDLYTVPAGKRLTVTMVSHTVSIAGSSIVFAGVTYSADSGGGLAAIFFVDPGLAVSAAGMSIHQKAQVVDLVLDEKTVLRAGTTRFNGDPDVTISFSGYLVDK